MKKLTLFAAIVSVGLMAVACCNNGGQAVEEEQLLQIGDNIAIAQTQYGKVKGYIYKGINTVLGIPYGASTSGENRFMPPKAPQPWD